MNDIVFLVENGIFLVVEFVLMLLSFRLIRRENRSMAAVFFAFGMVSWVVICTYWLVYNLLGTGERMPFAANEFGEAAGFLLPGSALYAVTKKDQPFWREDFLLPILITAGYTALWIGWSGEWVEDILTGAAYGYLLCRCCRSLREEKALRRAEQTVLGSAAVLIIVLEGLTFAVPGRVFAVLDPVCYLLMTASCLFFWILNIREIRRGGPAGRRMALSFSLFAWTVSCMYMSAGLWYDLFYASEMGALVLMYAAVREEVGRP